MTTAQYLLNIGLLAFVLLSNLGTRQLTWRRLAMPLILVAVAAALFLRDLPLLGNDGVLEIIGAAAGVALGVVAGLLVRVRYDGTRSLVMSAGIGYAVLWLVVIVGRCLFAFGADHWFGDSIARFSMHHLITGAAAWTAAFVLMALAMVVSRVATTAVKAYRVSQSAAPQPVLA